MPAQVAARDREVEGEQRDRDGDRRERSDVSLRRSRVSDDHRRDKEEHSRADEAELRKERSPVEALLRPDRLRDSEHEQEIRDHAAGERPANDLRQAVPDREERDDQLGRVAEARIQEAADAGTGVLGRMLGRLADQPRERDERGGGEHEEDRVARVRYVANDDRGGREGQRRPEDPSCHVAVA